MYLVELEQNINEWFYFDDQNNISRREEDKGDTGVGI